MIRKIKWEKRGFSAFSLGELGNSGQNLYISAKGVLQRIFNFDVNGDGYPDLLFANSQSMGERPPVYVYDSILTSENYTELPSGGSYEGVMVDLNGDGYEDLVIACQNDGTHTDITAVIYYGSKEGLSEKYRVELPAPDATGVAAGDFNGDGKPDLAFICGNFLRIFYQKECGIVASEYYDLTLSVVSVSAEDIDLDGYCDLYIKHTDGTTGVLWGGPQGLSTDTVTWIGTRTGKEKQEASTTPGRRPAYRGWRTNIVSLNGQKYLFRVDKEDVVLDRCSGNRDIKKEISLHCPGAIGVSGGDLDGDGLDDLAVAICTNKNSVEKSFVFWGSREGFSLDNTTCLETRSAQNLLITDLMCDGKNSLIVCQGGTSVSYCTKSLLLDFDVTRNLTRRNSFKSGDAMRILTGKTSERINKQVVVINRETGRVRGDEDIYIYLGGPNGYSKDRRIELPGWAAVDGVMYDFNDDGYVDVLISNCSENAPHMDPGSFLYVNGP